MQFSTGIIALAALLANPVYGHMVMKSPVPYGKSTLNNSPLLTDGSDFPCKQRSGVYEAEGASNVLEIGAPQTLSFTGGATHNGGSCQVSLTTDLAPTKDSKWMVIKSIEGGCPSAATGNCGSSASDSCASTFQYTVPEGIAPGKYTIAWSWINHTGNREFYMNCGPADVVGAKKKRYNPNPVVRRQSEFPDMFVANLASINDCTTPEGFDYIYPNPGGDVQSAGTGKYTQLACGAAGAGGAAQQPTASAGGQPAASGAASGASSAVVTSAAAAPTGATGSDGGFGSGASSAPAVSPGNFATVSAAAPQASAAATSAAAPAATGSSTGGTSSSSGSSSGATGSCTEGDWNCLDGKSFQRCASGTWSSTMAVSAGMSCQPGISSSLTWGPAKRVVRRDIGLFDGYVN